jgi:hypothetical protein
MNHLVFLLEEPSARDLLEGLLPRILPDSIDVHYLVFEGKQDLERQMVNKMRHWKKPGAGFVVLRDQDAAECQRVKQVLADLVAESGRSPSLVRVACRELESWVVGDWAAVAQAFERPQLAAHSVKEAYRTPDALQRPIEWIRKVIPDYQKRDGARRVGPLLDLGRNQSQSFRAFCRGLQRLVAGSP